MKKRYSAFTDILKLFNEEYGDFDISIFDKKLRQAMKLADKSLKFRIRTSSKSDLKGKSQQEIKTELARDILIDRLIYKESSFLETYVELNLNDETFDKFQYKMRTSNFMKKYGNKDVKFGRSERTLSEWLERYMAGKVKKRTMNKIISRFKKANESYLKKEGSS